MQTGRLLVTNGDAIEAIDQLAGRFLRALQDGEFAEAAIGAAIAATFGAQPGDESSLVAVAVFVCHELVPKLARTEDETANLLAALEGRYVPPGPSGAPTRGMAHVLPTGRNFYAVDPRCLPSHSAWEVGQALAREVIERHREATGSAPESVGISVWGTSRDSHSGGRCCRDPGALGSTPDLASRKSTGLGD